MTNRRQSKNSRLMNEVIKRMREYDLEEIRMLCERYAAKKESTPRSNRGRKPYKEIEE